MIRFANKNDADFVAPLIFQAMEEIVFKIIGKEDKKEAVSFLKKLFIQEENQYSYTNTIVFEENQNVIGSLVFYDGAKLRQLRNPVLSLAYQRYRHQVTLEDETQAGEIYIDTLSVNPIAQGKGIGSQLISFLKEYVLANNLGNIGLLVDEKNIQAERLYTRLGFYHTHNQSLAGSLYKHLIFESAQV